MKCPETAKPKQVGPILEQTILVPSSGDANTFEPVHEVTEQGGSRQIVLALAKSKGKDKGEVDETPTRKRSSKKRPLDEKSSKRVKRIKAVGTSSSAETPALLDLLGSSYDDAASSALLLSKVVCGGRLFPPADTLLRGEVFVEAAHLGVKFLASINEVVFGYDSDAQKARRQVENARQDANKLKKRLEEVEKELSVEKE